jgi:isocitrate dehydrogenase kinase/phosphatase
VHDEGDQLVIDHAIERRMTPLNLYIRTATREQAENALDYGQAIRDSRSPTSFRATLGHSASPAMAA